MKSVTNIIKNHCGAQMQHWCNEVVHMKYGSDIFMKDKQ